MPAMHPDLIHRLRDAGLSFAADCVADAETDPSSYLRAAHHINGRAAEAEALACELWRAPGCFDAYRRVRMRADLLGALAGAVQRAWVEALGAEEAAE